MNYGEKMEIAISNDYSMKEWFTVATSSPETKI